MRMVPPFEKNKHLGLERSDLPFDCCQRVALRSVQGGLPLPTFDTATFRVGVLAVEMSVRVPHGIAGSIGNSNFFLAF